MLTIPSLHPTRSHWSRFVLTYRRCNTYWPMLLRAFDYIGYTMSIRCHYYASTRTFVLGNCYVRRHCTNMRPWIVIDRFWLLMFHQLNNIHWTQYNEHRHCNNNCFHRTRIVPYALLTFRQWNNIQPLPYCAPVHWTIR